MAASAAQYETPQGETGKVDLFSQNTGKQALVFPRMVFQLGGTQGTTSKEQYFETEFVDYIKIQPIGVDYTQKGAGRFNTIPNNTDTAGSRIERNACVFLPIPQNLSVTYAPQYNQKSIGAMGAAVANALGGNNAGDIAQSLQSFAGNATSEVIYKSMASTASSLNTILGMESITLDGSTLMAMASGKIFNPYQEQIFEGIGFRTFSFNWKLLAKDATEAKTIGAIIKALKVFSLPRYAGAATGGKAATSFAQSGMEQTRTSPDRFLTVPDKFAISFVRVRHNGENFEQLGHFKMDLCVLTNLSVNYAPDGQYNAIHPNELAAYGMTGQKADEGNYLLVPAVNLDVQFTESSIMTADKAAIGF